MSRGVVLGVTWYEEGDVVERVIVASDERLRGAMDHILRAVPDDIRKDGARFWAPLLENNEPPTKGCYGGRPRCHYYWWKRAFIEETP